MYQRTTPSPIKASGPPLLLKEGSFGNDSYPCLSVFVCRSKDHAVIRFADLREDLDEIEHCNLKIENTRSFLRGRGAGAGHVVDGGDDG